MGTANLEILQGHLEYAAAFEPKTLNMKDASTIVIYLECLQFRTPHRKESAHEQRETLLLLAFQLAAGPVTSH